MSEYNRLGKEGFWDAYGQHINILDSEAITPALQELGATIAQKWRDLSNGYAVVLKDTGYEVYFDKVAPDEPMVVSIRYGASSAWGLVGDFVPQWDAAETRSRLKSFLRGHIKGL